MEGCISWWVSEELRRWVEVVVLGCGMKKEEGKIWRGDLLDIASEIAGISIERTGSFSSLKLREPDWSNPAPSSEFYLVHAGSVKSILTPVFFNDTNAMYYSVFQVVWAETNSSSAFNKCARRGNISVAPPRRFSINISSMILLLYMFLEISCSSWPVYAASGNEEILSPHHFKKLFLGEVALCRRILQPDQTQRHFSPRDLSCHLLFTSHDFVNNKNGQSGECYAWRDTLGSCFRDWKWSMSHAAWHNLEITDEKKLYVEKFEDPIQ